MPPPVEESFASQTLQCRRLWLAGSAESGCNNPALWGSPPQELLIYRQLYAIEVFPKLI